MDLRQTKFAVPFMILTFTEKKSVKRQCITVMKGAFLPRIESTF